MFKRFKPYWICTLGALFYLYDFLIRVITGTLSNVLMQQFNIAAAGLGLLSSFFFIGYMSMQIPCGMMYDRYGPKKLLTIMTLVSAVATFLFIATNSFFIASLARFFMGFGTAFAYIGALFLASRWLPSRYFVLTAGLIQFLGSIGAIVGEGPFADLVTHYGAYATVAGTAVIGIILAIAYAIFLQDYPEEKKHEYLKLQENPRSLSEVFSIKQNWYTALYAFMIWAPIAIFASLWAIPYLMQYYQSTRIAAASLTSIIWLGVALGGPILGWLSNKMNARKPPLFIASLIGVISAAFVLYNASLTPTLMMIMLFLFGVAGSAQAVTFGLIQDNNPTKLIGTASGFNNMAIVLGGAIFQPIVGEILNLTWNGTMYQNVIVYSHANFQLALTVLPVCYLISLLSLAFIRETHNKCVVE